MTILNNIGNYINNLGKRDFYIYVTIFLGSIILLTGIGTYYYNYKITSLREELNDINQQRKESNSIITRLEKIKRQRKEVAAMIAKQKEFNIKQYFEDTIAKLSLTASDPVRKIEPNETEKYQVETLDASFVNKINTQKLCELLSEFGKNERIFIKKLDIQKKSGNTISVDLQIATLQPIEGTE